MSKRWGVILFLLLAALFLIVNRAAYQGYFQDDELDNLSWTPYAPVTEYLQGALTPRFQENNFRPVGHYYFHAAEQLFGLDFRGYVALIHLFHLLNVWLLWLLIRRLGASPMATGAACFFFAFHMALFDALWKPMYVFDVLCATFCLLSLLCYARRLWVLSFVAYWLAYKSKEVAVMLPLVLACYEIWFGERRWKPLVPFFAASLSFGLQGLLLNPNKDNDYTFRFTPAALFKTSTFYAARIILLPYLGFLLPLGAVLARNRRTWFGLAAMGIFFFPMMFLPGRLFSAYCYVPFTGLAIACAGMVETLPPLWLAGLLLLWLPWDLHSLRAQRSVTLARDHDVREWVTTLSRYAATRPAVDAFVYSGAPEGFARWGIEGAAKYLFRRFDLKVAYIDEAEGVALRGKDKVPLLRWDPVRHQLDIGK